MALTQVTGPYPIFTDLDGSPLDDGYLYIGAINDDPETNPIQAFWDSALTIPATQPIRTSNGYAWRNGTPGLIYTAGQFSITIRNKRNEFVLYSPVGYGFDPAAVSASVVKNDFTGDGVEVDFTLSASPSTILATNVFINGVYQEKDSYSLLGNVITFSIAPPLSSSIEILTNETGVINSGNATAISYTAGFPGATAQTVQTKLEQYVSVKDFGAVGDGVTDDTAAFNAAIATGKAVYVPYTVDGYLVSNISVITNTYIIGEKSGVTQGGTQSSPLLIVSTSGTAAFYNSVGNNVFDVWFENLACKAAPGVTNASFYKSSTNTFYSAYFTFKNIETYLNLRAGYIGLFIFTVWDRCRDGYLGSSSDSEHTGVLALAGSYGQTNAQNIIMFRDCMFFNAFGGQGAVVASYGSRWSFENTDFEGLQSSAFVGYNIFDAVFDKCWFESITAAAVISAKTFTAASTVTVNNCTVYGTGTATYFINVDSPGTAVVRNTQFNLVPSGMTLCNSSSRLIINENNPVTSGTGVATFMSGLHPDVYSDGKRFLNGATDNAIPAFNIQNAGGISATLGFLSTSGLTVTTTFVDVAIPSGVGGLCFVSGFNTVGGAPGWWLVGFNSAGVKIIDDSDLTSTTPSFQVSAGKLQMKTTTGTLSINTTFLN